MRTLHIDIETYSDVDLARSGLYRYVQSPAFEILLFAYAYDDGPVQVVDLAQGEKIPYFTVMDLHRPEVAKMAHNAAFEYYCLSKFFDTRLDQWHCTMVHALYCGFPASLAKAGEAMGFAEDKKKMGIGRSLIRYFCIPCAPSRTNGGRTRNLPRHAPEKWKLFKDYCRQDVVTEREIENRLSPYPVPDAEHSLWVLDQMINIHGTALDMGLVDGALAIDAQTKGRLSKRAREITKLDNPNSVAQLKEWISQNSDVEVETLNKQTVADMLQERQGDELLQEMLRIRQEMGKTSVKKYQAMKDAACSDGRVRGLLQFYGANRTGRWAGRLVQVQNLPRNYIKSLDTARELVKGQKTEALQLIYGSVPDTLSQLVRTAFVPAEGCRFCVADFSAIEARVISWLAGEQWRLDVFRTHGKIYEASASSMFGVPIEKIRKGNPEYALRAKGKVAELALGYQGGKGALITMGALRQGLTEEELPDIVKRWRGSNRRIVDLWYTVENYAMDAVLRGTVSRMPCGITFRRDRNYLMIDLPGSRTLYYNSPRTGQNRFGNESLVYTGLDQTTKKWETIETYGGKLTENIVQAVARDLLANAMVNLSRAGYRICFHIHDEVILEVPEGSGQCLEEAVALMCRTPDWAEGLPLNADGFETYYYRKD